MFSQKGIEEYYQKYSEVLANERKQTGNEMYCTIMSVIETCKRKEMQVFDSIRQRNAGYILAGVPTLRITHHLLLGE